MSEFGESTLLVPLRSNAYGLVAGAPVELIRRRLKFASVTFDKIAIEGGDLRIDAGPGGSFVAPRHPNDKPGFQTSRERALAQSQGFQISIGVEETYGEPSANLNPFIQSKATIAWSATLVPFAHELPSDCDWVDWVRTIDLDGEHRELAERWTRADKANSALQKAVPAHFVREVVVKHANRDLVIAAASGTAIAQDRLHQQVAAQRFLDDGGWHGRGFAVPVLYPDVADFDWDDIRDLRRDRHMQSFRAILREVEAHALAEAQGGDLEAAVHHVHERFLGHAQGQLDQIGSVLRRQARGFILGAVTGVATMGITGPLGVLAGSLAGAGIGTVSDVGKMLRRRKQAGWVVVHQLLTGP